MTIDRVYRVEITYVENNVNGKDSVVLVPASQVECSTDPKWMLSHHFKRMLDEMELKGWKFDGTQ